MLFNFARDRQAAFELGVATKVTGFASADLAVRVTATAAEVAAAPVQSSSNGSVAPAAAPAQAIPGVVTPPEAFQKVHRACPGR